MARLHALELMPDDAGQDVVRRDWQALRDAGLPSQLIHAGATNAPHLTVVSASVLPEEAIGVARARLGSVLPFRVQVPDRQHAGWLPHVTLARGLSRDDAQRAVDALGYADVELTFTRLRRWDPDKESVTTVAGS